MPNRNNRNNVPAEPVNGLSGLLGFNEPVPPESTEPEVVELPTGEVVPLDPEFVQVDDTKNIDNVFAPEAEEEVDPDTLDTDDNEDETAESVVPRDGEVNPTPDNDADGQLQLQLSETAALRAQAAERLEVEGWSPTFESRVNSIDLREVVLKRTDEAVGIDVDQGGFRIYDAARFVLTEWEYAMLVEYVSPRDIVRGH